MESPSRVYVPSATESDGTAIGMGCFSTEEIAWQVLKTFLGKSEQMSLTEASVVAWDVDVLGEDGMTVLSSLEGKICPVCLRRTFWVDLEHLSALCYGSSCSAWIEQSTVDPEIVDCGWPPLRFLKQVKDIEEAYNELRTIGSDVASSMEQTNDAITQQMYESSFNDAQ
jgi:hypothetical protein